MSSVNVQFLLLRSSSVLFSTIQCVRKTESWKNEWKENEDQNTMSGAARREEKPDWKWEKERGPLRIVNGNGEIWTDETDIARAGAT